MSTVEMSLKFDLAHTKDLEILADVLKTLRRHLPEVRSVITKMESGVPDDHADEEKR